MARSSPTMDRVPHGVPMRPDGTSGAELRHRTRVNAFARRAHLTVLPVTDHLLAIPLQALIAGMVRACFVLRRLRDTVSTRLILLAIRSATRLVRVSGGAFLPLCAQVLAPLNLQPAGLSKALPPGGHSSRSSTVSRAARSVPRPSRDLELYVALVQWHLIAGPAAGGPPAPDTEFSSCSRTVAEGVARYLGLDIRTSFRVTNGASLVRWRSTGILLVDARLKASSISNRVWHELGHWMLGHRPLRLTLEQGRRGITESQRLAYREESQANAFARIFSDETLVREMVDRVNGRLQSPRFRHAFERQPLFLRACTPIDTHPRG